MEVKKGIDWSSLWTKEDWWWWTCWIGWFILLLAWVFNNAGWLHAPKLGKWPWAAVGEAFPKGIDTLWTTIIIIITITVLTLIGVAVMKLDWRRYVPAFLVIFLLAFLANFIAHQVQIKYWGIPYVLWALAFGLIISNVFCVPSWLKPGVLTEFFIKIGLVCMGAMIMFGVVMKAGGVGMRQTLLVVGAVWFFTYWLCRRFGLSQRFSSVIDSYRRFYLRCFGIYCCRRSHQRESQGNLRGSINAFNISCL